MGTVGYRLDETREGVSVGFANDRGRGLAFVTAVPEFRVFNEMIGADHGEVVPVPGIAGLALWIDETGAVATPPRRPNLVASIIAGQRIFGDAILIAADAEGETVSISPEQARLALDRLIEGLDRGSR